MPRPKSDRTVQVAFKITPHMIAMADEIAVGLAAACLEYSIARDFTRTSVLRAALMQGLTELQARARTKMLIVPYPPVPVAKRRRKLPAKGKQHGPRA